MRESETERGYTMPDSNETVVEGNQEKTPESEDTTQVDSTEETLPEVDETAQETEVDEAEQKRRDAQSIQDKGWQEAKNKEVETAKVTVERDFYKEQLDKAKTAPTEPGLSPNQVLDAAMLKDPELGPLAASLRAKIDLGEITKTDAGAEWARERRVFSATQQAQAAQTASHSSAASAEMKGIMSGVPDDQRGNVQTALNGLGLDINDPASYANADPEFIKNLVSHITNSVQFSSGGASNAPPPKPPKVMSASGATSTPVDNKGGDHESFQDLADRLKEQSGLT